MELFQDGRVKDIYKMYTKFDEVILYECNAKTCKCLGNCGNRMTPETFNLKVEVFKTPSAGYGVHSKSYIKSGLFFC